MRIQPNMFATDNLSKDKRLCFVIMPFTESFSKDIFDRIKSLCRNDFNIEAIRADDLFFPDTVMNAVWENLVKARFIVADVTGRNPNVYYELGLAHAIGKYVILLSQDETIPFDLASIRHLKYEWTPTGIKKFGGSFRKYLDVAMQATEGGAYYPKSDDEENSSWLEQVNNLNQNHLLEISKAREQQIELLTQIKKLEHRISAQELDSARMERTVVPKQILSAMHTLDYSVDVGNKIHAIAEILEARNRFPLPSVINLLARETDDRLRTAAVECIGKLGEAHHFQQLRAMLGESEDQRFVNACIRAMFKVNPEGLIDVFAAEMIKGSKNTMLILTLMHSSSKKWGLSHYGMLENLLADSDINIKWAALKVLTKHKDTAWSADHLDLGKVHQTMQKMSLQEYVLRCVEEYWSRDDSEKEVA